MKISLFPKNSFYFCSSLILENKVSEMKGFVLIGKLYNLYTMTKGY